MRTAGARRFGLAHALLVVVAIALAGCATLPPPEAVLNAASGTPQAGADRSAYNRRVFDDAWRWVNKRYYDADFNGADWAAARERHAAAAEAAADDETLYRAVNAMLEELDDKHTHARSPEAVRDGKRTRGVLVGLRTSPVPGAEEQRLVVDVIPQSPAADAGVQPGWILVRCDGRRPDEVLGIDKLADGQVVHCEFLDADGLAHVLDLAARPVSLVPARVAQMLPGGELLLRFDIFNTAAARWIRSQIEKHPDATGLVIDLRHNSGGAWPALLALLGDVFPEPVDIGTTIQRSGSGHEHRASRSWLGAKFNGPLAVLVGEGSASASEIFAHVVQYHRRGIIVGARTPGIVLASVSWPLPARGELQISVFDYRGVDGRRLEGVGIVPDIAVDTSLDDQRAGRDRTLEIAVRHMHVDLQLPHPPPIPDPHAANAPRS